MLSVWVTCSCNKKITYYNYVNKNNSCHITVSRLADDAIFESTYHMKSNEFDFEIVSDLRTALSNLYETDLSYIIMKNQDKYNIRIATDSCVCFKQTQESTLNILKKKFNIKIVEKIPKDTTDAYLVEVVDEFKLNSRIVTDNPKKVGEFNTLSYFNETDNMEFSVQFPLNIQDLPYKLALNNISTANLAHSNNYYKFEIPYTTDTSYMFKHFLEHYGLKFVPIKKVNYYKEVRFR